MNTRKDDTAFIVFSTCIALSFWYCVFSVLSMYGNIYLSGVADLAK